MTLPIGRRPNRFGCALGPGIGYTLIELILLTVIIAILVGISTPLFRKTYSNLELRDASYNLARLISFAQEKSIIEGTSYKFLLDTDESRYYLLRLDPKTKGKYIRLKERYGKTFSLPRGIKLRADKKEVIFYPDGHSQKATITFLGKTRRLRLKIKGNLGYVEIE